MTKIRCVACLKDIPDPQWMRITDFEWMQKYHKSETGIFVRFTAEITLTVPVSLSGPRVDQFCRTCIASWLLLETEQE